MKPMSLLLSLALISVVVIPEALGGQGGGYTLAGPVGRYYSNTNLTGTTGFTRRDVRLDFGLNSLPPGGVGRHGDLAFRSVPATGFSAQWTGQIIARFSETYTFSVNARDSFKLRLRPAGSADWSTVIDQTSYAGGTTTGTFAMTAGTVLDFEATLAHGDGPWAAQLRWSSPSTPGEVIDPLVESGINNPQWTSGFTDIVKGARNSWEPVNGAARPLMDTNGWPTSDCAYVLQESLNQGLDIDPLMRGLVTFSFTGKAKVSIQGNVRSGSLSCQYVSAQNRTVGSFVGFNNGWNATYITFAQTQRDASGSGGITDLRLMRPTAPDASASYDETNTLFTPQLLDAMGHFTVIRHQYVANQQRDWFERTRPEYFNQSGGASSSPHYGIGNASDNGVSWEVKVMLANESGRDLMISIPVVASGRTSADAGSYIWKLANLLRYGSDGVEPYTGPVADPAYPPLNPNLRVYLELENELWNWGGVFWTDWANINALVAADLQAGNEDFKSVNYDQLPLTQSPSGDYDSINTWRFRKILLRLYQISDIFRSVWDDENMMTHVRPLYEWQYANVNETARLALVFGDRYFNNGDGQAHVANPQPVSHWLWGGGGATYYGAVNGNGLTDLISDPSFASPTLPQAGYQAAPTGGGWTFSGGAGIARNGAAPADIPPAFKGSQMGYITDTGSISVKVTFPTNGTSPIFAVCFKALNRLPVGATNADRQNLRVYLDDTNDITTRTFSQGNGCTPLAYDASNPWYANNVFWTQSEYYYTKSFTVEPGSTHTITFKGRGDINTATNVNQTAFLGEVRVTSVDRVFEDGMPGGGEAAGQPAGLNIQNTMNTEASWAKAFGLEQLSYEGGWSLGGDDGGSSIQLNAKYGDSRTARVQGRFMDMFHKAGSAVNVFGTYAQWPDWTDFYARQGLMDVSQYPIIQGMDDRASQLRPEPENGLMAPCKLKVASASLTDNVDNTGRITQAGGWINWNVITPDAATYAVQAVLTSAGSNGCVLLVDDKPVAGAGQLSGTLFLTKGLHSVKVRRVSATLIQIDSVTISSVGGPGSPESVSVSDGDGQAILTWSPTPGATYYQVRYGTSSGVYTTILDVGTGTSLVVSNLVNNQQYFFTVLAGSGGSLSMPSTEQGVIPLGANSPGRLAIWEFQGSTGNETSATPGSASSRVVAGALHRGAGLNPSTADWAASMRVNRFASEAVGNVYATNLEQAAALKQYYEFSLKAVPGQKISLSKIEFLAFFQNGSGGAGVTCSTDGTNFNHPLTAIGSAASSTTAWTVDLTNESALQNMIGTVAFRIYLYGLGAYQVSALGDSSGADLTVTGSVSPSLVALSITPESSAIAKLTWPSNGLTYKVVHAPSVYPESSWIAISNPPSLEDGMWAVRVSSDSQSGFYRLAY